MDSISTTACCAVTISPVSVSVRRPLTCSERALLFSDSDGSDHVASVGSPGTDLTEVRFVLYNPNLGARHAYLTCRVSPGLPFHEDRPSILEVPPSPTSP